MADAEFEQAELDGWPTFSLSSATVRELDGDRFRELLQQPAERGIYAVQTASGGVLSARIIDHHRLSVTDGCQYFLETYLADTTLNWEPEWLFLLNEPCYIATGSGAVLLEDGRIVTDTLFPTGRRSLAGRVGGGLTIANLAREIEKAPTVEDGVWAPLLSHGSSVYGHVLAESMVQDSAFRRAGLSPLISYAATAWTHGAQRIAVARAHSPVTKFHAALVKVPRVLFASKLYRHLPLGLEYAQCVAAIKAGLPADGMQLEPPADKIYVSRLGVDGRRMTNEAELIDVLTKMGFRIVAGENLSFEEQVYTFRAARLIVGPYGSGLVNAAFAAPHAALCELRSLNNPHNSPNWDNYYLGLATMMGFSYGVSVTENAPGADIWECDIPDAMELIRTAAEALGGSRLLDDDAIAISHSRDGISRDPPRFWARPNLAGLDSYSLMAQLHANIPFKSYLELGSGDGSAFALARCPSIAVDPDLSINDGTLGDKPACLLFRMKSDAFFAAHDPTSLLGCAPELALLQDHHSFEQVLRDILNLERRLARNSCILINNCIPTDAHIGRGIQEDQSFARFSEHPDWWAGDVWKAIAVLKELRPDLTIHAFDAFPTGLVAITNLDPASEVLADHYNEVVARYRPINLADYGVERYFETLALRHATAFSNIESLASLFTQ